MPEESDDLAYDGKGDNWKPVSLDTGQPTFENNQVRIPIRLKVYPTEQPIQIDTALAFDLKTLEDFVSKLKEKSQ